jgi:hypothetical protein
VPPGAGHAARIHTLSILPLRAVWWLWCVTTAECTEAGVAALCTLRCFELLAVRQYADRGSFCRVALSYLVLWATTGGPRWPLRSMVAAVYPAVLTQRVPQAWIRQRLAA